MAGAAACLLIAACERTAELGDQAEKAARELAVRAEAVGQRIDELQAKAEAHMDTTSVRYAGELSDLERRQREIAEELAWARRAGEKQWRAAHQRLEEEMAALEKRAGELDQSLADPF